MQVANYTSVRNDFKTYFDEVSKSDSTLLVTKKEGNPVIMMAFDAYNELQKELRNKSYLAKLHKSYNQIADGRGITRDLIDDE